MTWPTMPAWLTWERVAWVVVLVFGTGIYGTWSQRDIEKQRIVMDARKQAVELGEQENKVLVQIVEVTSILQRIEAAERAGKQDLDGVPIAGRKGLFEFQRGRLYESYDSVELKLAQVEERQPRVSPWNRTLSAPYNIRLSPN